MPFELLFVIGLFGLYLYDSTLSCYSNEVFICHGLTNRSRSRLAHMQLRLGKRFLNWPNLCFPQRLVFRCQWQLLPMKMMQQQELAQIQTLKKILKPLQWTTFLLSILTLIALPAVILLKLNVLTLAIVIVMIYGLNIYNACYLLFKRQSLNLANKRLLHILLDSLLCPAFALNTVAKISLSMPIHSDATQLAKALLSAKAYANFNHNLSQSIQQLKQQYEQSDPHYQKLEQRQSALSLDQNLS